MRATPRPGRTHLSLLGREGRVSQRVGRRLHGHPGRVRQRTEGWHRRRHRLCLACGIGAPAAGRWRRHYRVLAAGCRGG